MRKAAFLDLKDNKVSIVTVEDDEEIAASEDDLIFKAPYLAGYGVIGINKLEIYSNHTISKVGGYFAHYMKCNGYDYLVLKNKSPIPVYISIYKEEINLYDARDILYKNSIETEAEIKRQLDDKELEFAEIGIAGVHKIDFSRIMFGSKKSCGKNGLGKLMGEKYIKAIALKKCENLEAKNKQSILMINKLIASRLDDFSLEEYYKENNSCYGCNLNCKSTSIRKLYKMGFSIEDSNRIDNICNEYGMDSLVFSKLVDSEDEFENLAKRIVYGEYKYSLENSRKNKSLDYENKFEKLGFCRFLIKKDIITENEINELIENILE